MSEENASLTIPRLLPHIATRVLNAPLMIAEEKLDTILTVLGPRIGLDGEASEITLAAPGDKKRKGRTDLVGNVAVIDIAGTLAHKVSGLDALSGMTSYADIQAEIAAAANDAKTGAILLLVDSPGGEVHGSFDLADAIHAVRGVKPVAALASETAASAAYLLASAAEQVFVAQSGIVGSIGVIGRHIDRTGANAQRGMNVTVLTAGAGKGFGNSDEPLTDESRAYLQQRLDSFYGLFVEKVTAFRSAHLTPDKVRGMGAKVFRGPEAVAAGLADAVKTKDQAIAWLSERAADGRPAKASKKDPIMSQQNSTVTAEALAAFLAEHPQEGAALQAAAATAAVTAERGRIATLQTLAEAGQEELLAQYVKDGTDPTTAALGFAKDRREKQTKSLANLTGDRPQAVASPPVDPANSPQPKIDANAPIDERASAEWDADGKIRTEFAGDKEAYVAWRKRNPT